MKDDRVYLLHFQQSIADIDEYIADGRDAFTESKLIRDAVIRK